jgi:site-specific DNA recombinase
LRKRGGYSPHCGAHQECPRDQWIEIPVPALVSEDLFELAQEKLQYNKRHSPRRTIEPTLLQGMLVCKNCGYAYYRSSTRTSKRKLYYYRCIGSDNYRFARGRICHNRPIRQDYLDKIVWTKIVELLTNPDLVRAEIKRRIKAIQDANPTKQRKDAIEKELLRNDKSVKKLLDAYQEDLLQLEELRDRMPALRKRQKALQTELVSLEGTVADQQAVLRLANNLVSFLKQLKDAADTIDVKEQQKLLQLLVKEILVDDEDIKIKHSIPLLPSHNPRESNNHSEIPGYLLRSGRHHRALR